MMQRFFRMGSRKDGFSKMVSARAFSVILFISSASSSFFTQNGIKPQLNISTSSDVVMMGYLGKLKALT